MKKKCDLCGKMAQLNYRYTRNDPVFDYELEFCDDCGQKIQEEIDRLLNERLLKEMAKTR